MPITVTEDDTESGGHAFVDLGRLAGSPLPCLSIRRQDAEPRHLGVEGWQPEVAWLRPMSADSIGGRTVVRFGPAVVDRIADLVPIEILEEGAGSFGVVQWPYVTPAPQSMGVTIEPAGPTRPHPVAVPQPPYPEGSEPAATSVAGSDPPSRPAPPRPPPAPASSTGPVVSAPSARAPRRGRALAAVLLLLLVGAGAGGIYLFRDRLALPPAPPSQPRPDVAAFERQFTDLLQSRPATPDILAFGNRALEAGHGAVAFRAFEEADPAASEEAAWQLARFYDPRVTDAPVRAAALPNPASAAYYHALWRGRSTRHSAELRALCDMNLTGPAGDRMRAFCQT